MKEIIVNRKVDLKYGYFSCFKCKLFLFFITIIFFQCCFSQNKSGDSTAIIYHLNKSNNFFEGVVQVDSIAWHAKKGIELANENNFHKKDPALYRYLGLSFYFTRTLDSAAICYKKSIKWAMLYNDFLSIAKGLQNLGGVSYEQGNYDEALDYFIGAVKVNSALHNYSGLAGSLVNTARIYQAIGDQQKVHEYILKCLNIITFLENEPNSKEQVYSVASEYYIKESNVDSALIDSAFIFINNGYRLVEDNNWTNRIGFYQNFMGAYYFQLRNYDSAAYFINKALNNKKYLSSISLGNSYLIMSQIKMKENKIEDALAYTDSALVIDNYLTGDRLIPYHNVLYQIHKRGKNYQFALENLEKEKRLRDSITTREKVNSLLELETKFKTEIKDAEIKQLNQERKILELESNNQAARITWLTVIALIAILILMIILVLFRQLKISNEIELIQAEQRLNRSRINPHFLNNAFTGIQAMALEPNSEEKLISFTGGVSRYSRLLLESTLHDEWSLQNEFELIQQFTNIYLHKFKDRYQVNIENPPFNLKECAIQIPSAISQTLLENAFEHSVSQNQKATIQISFYKNEEYVGIQIINSLGETNLGNKRNENEKAQGLIIAMSRISLYNKKHKKSAHLLRLKEDNYFITKLEFN